LKIDTLMKRKCIFLLFPIVVCVTACKKSDQLSPPKIIPSPEKKWIVTTVAGNGLAYFANGPALMAEFRAPLDVAIADDGTIYVADAINHRIRKIASGQVSTFAGIGVQDTTSGSGNVAGFAFPSYIALDRDQNLYTLDVEDPRVRKISPAAFVSVVAGNGVNGFVDGRSDTAQFGKECAGITIDEQGNIYVSDWKSRRIRKISNTGHVTTVAGNGQSGFADGDAATAQFFNPAGIVIDKQGNLFVADFNRVRKITVLGIVSTFIGKDSTGFRDGQNDEALFSDLTDMVIDEQENIYVSDGNRIRRITPRGEVSTIAGGAVGYEDGDAKTAKFNGPVGLGIDKQGNIYVADDHNNRIRKISFE
jgi:sugar lactone lactonase YvrE